MNLPQRVILLIIATIFLWLCICTPRTSTERYGGQFYVYQENHRYFWESAWDFQPTDYKRLLVEMAAVILVGGSVMFAVGSNPASTSSGKTPPSSPSL